MCSTTTASCCSSAQESGFDVHVLELWAGQQHGSPKVGAPET
jgi:hypothetical protein